MAPPVTSVQEKLRKKTCDHLIIFVLGSGQDKANRLNQYTKFAERGIETTGHGSTHQVRQQITVTCLCAQSKDPRNRKKQTLKVHRHGSRQIQTRPVAWETKAQESKVVRTNSHRTQRHQKHCKSWSYPQMTHNESSPGVKGAARHAVLSNQE